MKGFLGFFAGIIFAVIAIAASLWLDCKKNPQNAYTPDYLLNSPEWQIDTIVTQSKTGIDTTYKFIKVL